MNNIEKAKYYGNSLYELADIIQDCLEDDNFDEAGKFLIDLQEYVTKLDSALDNIIE